MEELATGKRRTHELTGDQLRANWEALLPYREKAIAALNRRYGEFQYAEDIVHEAMLKLVSLPDLQTHRAGGLLAITSDRIAIDQYRRRKLEGEIRPRLIAPPDASPDEVAVDRAEAARLASMIPRLPPNQQAALLGRAQGLEPHETAAALGIAPKRVHLALARARDTLRRAAGPVGILIGSWIRRGQRSVRRLVQAGALAGGSMLLSAILLHPQSITASSPHAAQPRTAFAPHPSAVVAAGGAAAAARATTPTSSTAPPRPANGPYGQAPSAIGTTTVIAVAPPDQRLGSGTIVTVTHSNSQESFLQSLTACLQPSAISINPSQAGCNR